MKLRLFILTFLLAACYPASAQPTSASMQDTLPAAVKVADRAALVRADGYQLDPIKTLRIVSPLGDGDAIKYIQTLPGVATGGEGGSAIYVRGGNMGSNLLTLDGVPIYGISHLLGMTTVYSPDIIGKMAFHAGGFSSEEGNFTASHIRLTSVDGTFDKGWAQASVTPFLAGVSGSVPLVRDKLSFTGSVRISPLGLEYRAARGLINRYQNALQDFGALVGDVSGKLSWRPNPRNEVSMLLFGSLDKYRFVLNQDATDGLGWSNAITNLSWDCHSIPWLDALHTAVSFNDHRGNQEQESVLVGSYNCYQLQNALDELTLQSTAARQVGNWSFRFGVKARGARFLPGSASEFAGSSHRDAAETRMGNSRQTTLLATLHGQVEYERQDRFLARLALRMNGYFTRADILTGGPGVKIYHPEADLTLRFHFTRQIGLELTGDYLTQYYHTLEGIPLGWSLDMIVPSDGKILPERALQGYAGLFGGLGAHQFRAGAYYKRMDNLVYYGEAAQFFSTSQTDWYNNIRVGEGSSYGAEFLYEKSGEILSWRLAYTLSKTDRYFPELNRGRRFPAKYDRRHIANASLEWNIIRHSTRQLSLQTLFTYQSGSWDTLQDGSLPGFPIIGEKAWHSVPMISSLNNYEMPPFIRWDASLHYEIQRQIAHFDLSFGIYNILNRHNPIMLRYNTDTQEWNLISLFPVMPVLSIRISFNR